MARAKKYRSPEETRRVSVFQIAGETGRPYSQVKRWLIRNAWWVGAKPQGFPPTYDARVIDVLNHLAGRPARVIGDPQSDWLADYLRGGTPNAGDPPARTGEEGPSSP